MNDQSNLPAQRRETSPLDVLKRTVANKADEFKAVLPSHISIDKFQRTIATAALQNPKLMECDRKSLLMASMKAAQDGLLPDGREAALVPFKVNRKIDGEWQSWWEVQYIPMAWGLRKKVLQSGEVISLETGVIYAAEVRGGNFVYEVGMDPPIRYRPKLDLTPEETTDDQIVAAFSVARLKNPTGGTPYYSVEVMRRFEIDKVRQMSQTGAIGRVDPRTKRPLEPKGPWVDWFPAMAEKTALRQHTKVLPQSGDLLDTLGRDDEEEARAQSAARYLEVEPAAPVALPRNEDLAKETIDAETGEITTDSRGMTEVDEETARQLDAGQDPLDPDLDDEEDEQAAAAQQTVDAIDGPLEEATTDEPMWLAAVNGIMGSIAQARTTKAIDNIERDWLNRIRVGVPDDAAIRAVESAIKNKKRDLRAQQEG